MILVFPTISPGPPGCAHRSTELDPKAQIRPIPSPPCHITGPVAALQEPRAAQGQTKPRGHCATESTGGRNVHKVPATSSDLVQDSAAPGVPTGPPNWTHKPQKGRF